MSYNRCFDFYIKSPRGPRIEYLIDYTISDREGYIHFDGYYYVLDDELPIHIFYSTTLYEDKPYEIVETKYGPHEKYKEIEEKYYEIEIYKIEKIKNTSEFGEMEDEDGSTMKVCFFPTHEQKIYFRIINEFKSDKELFKRINEFNEIQQKDK
jgi:hypothetical protein